MRDRDARIASADDFASGGDNHGRLALMRDGGKFDVDPDMRMLMKSPKSAAIASHRKLRRCSNRERAAAMSRRKQVCLFGLSGDPPTGDSGHVGIVKTLSSMDDFDQVRVLPVYSHTFSVKHQIACCCFACINQIIVFISHLLFIGKARQTCVV